MGTPFPGKWTWDHHPWLKGMHDSKAEKNVGQKAAQVGYTELVLNLTFYTLDIKRLHCLYLLPNKFPDAADFSVARFNQAVELSPYLSSLGINTNNIGHKKFGQANLYIRGMNSRRALKGLPVSGLIFDELDEMDREQITLAEARSDGQNESWDWKISTPRIPNKGINQYYLESTEENFFFPCPHCSRQIELKFPESIMVTGKDLDDPELINSHYICYACKAKLDHETKSSYLTKGEWVPSRTNTAIRGFHVGQMYSSAKAGIPANFARRYIKSTLDPADEQEFFNSNVGIPHVVADAKLTEGEINRCIQSYEITDHAKSTQLITMGIDVGKVCHFEVDEWLLSNYVGDEINMNAVPKVLAYGTCDFDGLVKLMYNFQVRYAVIDAQPETRMAQEFAYKFPGYVKLCYYSYFVKAKNIGHSEVDMAITVNRTAWIDLALTRFRSQRILLPRTTSKEYKDHMCAQIKVPKRDKYGHAIYFYETPGREADHFGHARTYAEIALPLAMGIGPSTNSEKVM